MKGIEIPIPLQTPITDICMVFVRGENVSPKFEK